jgi:hypothetical protein
MSQTLLDLGASPAQADLKQKSPLYYLAHSDKFDILDIYMQHDEPAVKRAINHMAVLGTSWTPEYSSALMIALAAKNAPAASKLLGAGAQPEINIGEIVKLITASRGTNNFYDVEDAARSSVKQPIFLAIENDLPLVAIDLLHRGANPNAVIKGKYESKGRTLLDVMRQTLRTLREFLVERKYQSYYHSVATPLDPSDETYLSEFQSGSYKMFTAKDLLRNVRKLNRQTEEQAEKAKAIPDDPPGLVEKKAFIAELVRDYEKLEFIMLQKDAKTWDELHPPQNVPMSIAAQVPTNKPAQLPRMPWKVSFSFDVPAITDNARDGYLQL